MLAWRCCEEIYKNASLIHTVEKSLLDVNRLDEKTLRERIEYAEQMVQRLKTGPKQLESAYKLSNILSLQAEQRQVRAEQKKLE